MRVNVKGVGVIEFPDGVSKEKIKEFLSDKFSTKKSQEEEIKALRDIIASVIKEGEFIKPPADINVDLEPVFEVITPAPDMEPVAKAIENINIAPPSINVSPPDVHIDRELRKVEVEVTDRDTRGNIKKLMWTELE